MQWYEILHKVKARWIECRSLTEYKILYHCTNQCHSPFVNTTPQMLTKLNKIDKNLVPWMSQISLFFFLLAKYSQRTRNAYFIHITILVCDKIAPIHTNMQCKVIVTSCTAGKWYVTARLCNGTICCTFSSHRLEHNKLTILNLTSIPTWSFLWHR